MKRAISARRKLSRGDRRLQRETFHERHPLLILVHVVARVWARHDGYRISVCPKSGL